MTKRGIQHAQGKASQPRALRARKRKLPETEESATTGDTKKPQPEEPAGSCICELTSNGLRENSAQLTKDVTANDSCTEANLPSVAVAHLQLDCTTAQKDRGASASLEAGNSDELDQRGALRNEAFSNTERVVPRVLEEASDQAFPELTTDNERGAPQQHGGSRLHSTREANLRGTDRREEDADIQHHPCATCPRIAQCPPGCRSPPPPCDRSEVGRRSSRADGAAGRDGEDNKESQHLHVQGGAGVHPSGQLELGEGKGTGSAAEERQSLAGGRTEDGPAKKKVRKRMGMWGFGDRERRSHCEGWLAGRNLKKGESETAREELGKTDTQEEGTHSPCHKEVMEKSLEVTACKMAANNTHLTTREGSLAIPCGLAKQPGAFPSGSDLSLSTPSTPLDTIPEEEEPSQPEREGPYNGQQQFPAEKATTLVTKTSSAAVSAEKTTSSEDTHPCGMAEDAAEHITSELSGESKAPSAELGAASCDGGRHVTNPCAVQEEDCDLSITVLEKEKKDQSRQAMSGGKEVAEARADSFFEPGVSGATDLSETSTGNIPSGVVGSASPKCTSQLDPNVPSGTASAGTEVSVEHEAVGEAKPAPCSAQGSGEVSASVETWGTEQAGQESPRDLQEASGTEDNAEPPELEEPGGDLRGDVGTRSTEGDPARDSGKASAAGRVATEALPRKHRPPHCVPVSVDVHIDQAGCEAETQMVSDQVSLSDTDANPHQQPDGEDGGRLDTVVSSSSSSSVQETDSEEGRPGSVCSSVLNSMCEDKPLTCDDFVRSQQVQNFRAQSPKPSDNPDFDPSTPLSLGSLSDSQLNNIAFSPSECSETADDADNSSEQQEDATELVCGLIKELSSLNRTVMAAHRELDNLRRGNKASKPPHRHSYCSRHSEI